MWNIPVFQCFICSILFSILNWRVLYTRWKGYQFWPWEVKQSFHSPSKLFLCTTWICMFKNTMLYHYSHILKSISVYVWKCVCIYRLAIQYPVIYSAVLLIAKRGYIFSINFEMWYLKDEYPNFKLLNYLGLPRPASNDGTFCTFLLRILEIWKNSESLFEVWGSQMSSFPLLWTIWHNRKLAPWGLRFTLLIVIKKLAQFSILTYIPLRVNPNWVYVAQAVIYSPTIESVSVSVHSQEAVTSPTASACPESRLKPQMV